MNVDVNKIIDKLAGKLALLERDNAILLAQVESLMEALENLQKEQSEKAHAGRSPSLDRGSEKESPDQE